MDSFSTAEYHRLVKEAAPWYRNPGTLRLYLLLLSAMVTSSAWGFDLSMTNSLQSVDQFMDRFGNPSGAELGFYGASASVGGMVATILAGPLVDRLGRRAPLFGGAAVVIGMAIMQTFSPTFQVFTAGKLVLGFGANLQQVAGPMLVMELAHPKSREAISSLYNTSIYIGLISGAWITFGTFRMDSAWSWKIPCLLQIALPTYQLLSIWFCPESPRWLVSRGRLEEARAILIKYHGNGQETDLVRYELQEIVAGIESDKTQIKPNKEGIRTILGSRGNLHRLWIAMVTAVGSQCAGSSLISAYLPQILDQVGFGTSKDKTLINGLVNIVSWIAGVTAALFIPHIRRRMVFLWSTTGMLITFIIWTILSARYIETSDKGMGIGVVAMIFIYNIIYCTCWLPLVITYPLETVTTKQRGLFFSWTVFCINGSNFAVAYINPIGLENISWRYYIIQTIFILIVLIAVYFTFVETTGLTLEEVAVVFDGEPEVRKLEKEIEKEKEDVAGVQVEDVKEKV
ncbi:general substrate transporter [Aspergillus karnatakaensis]|uniref:general substrate transporter n=1 Tax=Aspergillus karnatakaensis TaxID=1810916 RepID=UPI003CCD3E08